jgi:hypothetical protein
MNMQIDLSALTYINDRDLFKIIISSADLFPGLYRISSSWKQTLEQKHYLKLLPLMEIIFHSEKGRKWTRDQWLAAHNDIFNLSYGKESRNEQREENDIKLLLKNKGYSWYKEPESFSLALIDSETSVTHIEPNKTYYMMGSLLRFEEKRFLVSYDSVSHDFALSLNVGYQEALEYINSTFSSDSLKNLFLQAEIVAHLNFDKENVGTLHYNVATIEELMGRFPPNCPIFASVNRTPNLPIRFAKLIGVSNVIS